MALISMRRIGMLVSVAALMVAMAMPAFADKGGAAMLALAASVGP